jgi:hypothetical protein
MYSRTLFADASGGRRGRGRCGCGLRRPASSHAPASGYATRTRVCGGGYGLRRRCSAPALASRRAGRAVVVPAVLPAGAADPHALTPFRG